MGTYPDWFVQSGSIQTHLVYHSWDLQCLSIYDPLSYPLKIPDPYILIKDGKKNYALWKQDLLEAQLLSNLGVTHTLTHGQCNE